MAHILRVRVEDSELEALKARGDAQRLDVELAAERLVRDALKTYPLGGRVVVLGPDTLDALEPILGGGSVLSGTDLLEKVSRLAGVSFLHVRLPFTPNQLEALADKAARQSLTVEELVRRTAPRMYEHFFDLVERV